MIFNKHFLLSIIIVLLLCPIFLSAQDTIPEIGKSIPDFVLQDIQYYHKNKATREDFHSTPFILDFFSMGCKACFQSFSKTNTLSKEFRNKVDIILIGVEHKKIRATYEAFREKQNLELPVVYDSILCKRWQISGYPHTIWVDGSGIVKAVTSGQYLTSENISSFINGESLDFKDRSYEGRIKEQNLYTYETPLLIDGNGGEDTEFLFRSLLARWQLTVPQSILSRIDALIEDGKATDVGMFQVTGATLEMLYEFAYNGSEIDVFNDEIYPIPILKLNDTILFLYDFKTGKGLYNYSLIVPKEKASREYFMEVMQRDLKNYFGYNVSLENYKVPYWSIKINSKWKEKLRSKKDQLVTIDGSHAGYTFKNVPMLRIIKKIASYHQTGPPFVDETGLEYNIDVRIDGLMTDLEDIKKAFAKQGLILERGEKLMRALVISQPENDLFRPSTPNPDNK